MIILYSSLCRVINLGLKKLKRQMQYHLKDIYYTLCGREACRWSSRWVNKSR